MSEDAPLAAGAEELADPGALLARAQELVDYATDFLRKSLAASVTRAVSVGLLGSLARNESSLTSDIDYYVVVDRRNCELDPESLARLMQDLGSAVREHAQDALGQRFSVYWTTLEDAIANQVSVGRFPAYDRALLKSASRPIAGFALPREALPTIDLRTLQTESIEFLLTEMRPRLDALGVLRNASAVSADLLAAWGEVLLPKLVLMPVRLIYLTLPDSEREPLVSTERAAAAFLRTPVSAALAPLVEAALQWRHSPPSSATEWSAAAETLRRDVVELYACLVQRYLALSDSLGIEDARSAFALWQAEFTRS